jgi:Flp pilus assembly protein TadG
MRVEGETFKAALERHMRHVSMSRNKQIRRGAATVETALVLSICFVFMFGLFDFCRLLMVRQVVANAAREGARYATVSTISVNTAAVQSVVTNFLAGQVPGGATIQVYLANPSTGANIGDWTTAQLGQAIGVQVTASYTPMLSKFSLLPSSVPIVETAIMRSEAN